MPCVLSVPVEKTIKAFLYSQGEEIVLGHSVERLCDAASHYEQAFADKAKRWSLLDGYYIPTRYPSGLPDGIPAKVYTQEAAENAVHLAEEAVTWVGDLLSPAK